MRAHLQFLVLAGCLHGVPDDLEVKPTPKPTPAPLPVEQAVEPGDRTRGPMWIDAAPQADAGFAAAVQRDATRVLSADDRTADAAVIEELVLGWSDGPTPQAAQDTRNFLQQLRNGPSLDASYMRTLVENLTRPFDGCVRPFANEKPCVASDGGALHPEAAAAAIEKDGDVVVLKVRDFNGVGTFDLAPLMSAKAVVLDLTEARGGHVTWLLPWIQKLAGPSWRKPIHAITTSAHADLDIRAYQERFLPDASRDPVEWAALVDPSRHPPVAKTTSVPIEILIDHACHSACELVTRMLETYTDARVYGQVLTYGRLYADDPARIVLPGSKVTIYYYATHYDLDPAIVEATGKTNDWSHAHTVAAPELDFAIGEAMRRLAHTEIDCKALPAVPFERLGSLHGLDATHFQVAAATEGRISVASRLPADSVLRIAQQCGLPESTTIGGAYGPYNFALGTPGKLDIAALSRFAQYPGIEKVRVDPITSYTIDGY
ncbi:MAG: S41 family peptidase [Kofleriaceae bacterium]